MSGVTVGDGAVIAANSTVVKDAMPYEIVGGNPAKVIKKRFSEEVTALLLRLAWWDLNVNVICRINEDLSKVPSIGALRALISKYCED